VIFLVLSILANVAIFMSFRSFKKFGINTFPAIITNYLVCVLTGFLYAGRTTISQQFDASAPWFYAAMVLGVIFVTTFYLMAKTTQLRGVAVATVASKMSLAIPVIFSLFIFKIGTNTLDNWNYLGIFLAFIAILMVTKKSHQKESNLMAIKNLGLPFLLFLMGGLIDTSLNYVNLNILNASIEAVFPIFIFCFAFISGIILALIKGIKFRRKDILGGIYLGIPNYFSIFFQLKALSAYDNNGALVYPSLNIGIIILSTLAAILFFQEKLTKLNWTGIGLALIVIFLLSHQEILT
jgi:drug/metabolite transporter (DMT)-like permease